MGMKRLWGIHNDQPHLDFLGDGFVSVGWDEIGDLTQIGADKDELKGRVKAAYPQAKPGAIPVWAGVLMRFAFDLEVGDLVVYPHKADSTVSFGRVTGDYRYDATAADHRHRRDVEWLEVGVPRAAFSKSARYEIGSAVTLFRVKNHTDEFLDHLNGRRGVDGEAVARPPIDVSVEEAADTAEDEPNAERIETYTRDFIIETLMKQLDGPRFEHFVRHLLEAMGYRANVTQVSGDGGVDVVAHRDPLGLEPPIIKVQCKRTLSTTSSTDVQKLTGTLAPGGSELGLFVTLGTYSNDAKHLGRTRQDLKLVNGNDLVDLVFEYYEDLSPTWQRLLPMRAVYVVDREPEAM